MCIFLLIARAHCDDYCTRTLGYNKSNILFVQGLIEKLEEAGIEAGAYNVCLSNCVLNLSPDKPAVLREVYRALSDGGEFYFSDIYSTSCLAPEVRLNPLLWGECLAGCLQVEEFEEYARGAGFQHPRVLALSPVEIYDASLRDLVGGTRFFTFSRPCRRDPLFHVRTLLFCRLMCVVHTLFDTTQDIYRKYILSSSCACLLCSIS